MLISLSSRQLVTNCVYVLVLVGVTDAFPGVYTAATGLVGCTVVFVFAQNCRL